MADLKSLDFLKGTKHFLRKLSGTPSNKSRRSQSATTLRSSQSATTLMPAKKTVSGERLSYLRQDMERKTERLNDSKFEVTEAWLFVFASQHAEYMEKATSRAGTGHEFRSTNDMFQHVLQHPRVKELIGGKAGVQSLQSASAEKPKPKPPTTQPDAQMSLNPSSTDTPDSTECSAAEAVEHSEQAKSEQPAAVGKDEVTSEACPKDSVAATDASSAGRHAEVKQVASWRFAPAARHSAPLPFAPMALPAASEAVRSKVRSSSCGGICKAPSDRRRASWSASDAQPAEESELTLKLQQRAKGASWGRISPRSRRLAEPESKPKSADDTFERNLDTFEQNLAGRRKLLESKLASCGYSGFQKSAASGGA